MNVFQKNAKQSNNEKLPTYANLKRILEKLPILKEFWKNCF